MPKLYTSLSTSPFASLSLALTIPKFAILATQRGQNTGEQNEQEDRERERERRQIQTKNEYTESERKQRETWKEKKTREEDQEQRDKENPGEHKINKERFLGFLPGLQQRNVCCLLNNRSPNHPKTKETETDTNRDGENKKSKKKPSKEKQDQKGETKTDTNRDSMALTRNETPVFRPERFDRNLTGISGSTRDFKRGETCSILFRFFNWYETFRAFRPKRNGIKNFACHYKKSVSMHF